MLSNGSAVAEFLEYSRILKVRIDQSASCIIDTGTTHLAGKSSLSSWRDSSPGTPRCLAAKTKAALKKHSLAKSRQLRRLGKSDFSTRVNTNQLIKCSFDHD